MPSFRIRAALFATAAVTLLGFAAFLSTWWFAAGGVVMLSRAVWLSTTEHTCPSS